jgi:hypothetical protein
MIPDQPPGSITVGRFVHLYKLLSRYSDLLVLLKAEYPAADKLTDDCLICLNHDQNIIVLSFSHKLCSKCSKRWVSRHLKCPFCHHGFSRNDVRKNQWEMLEWQSQDVEEDVAMFQQRLEEFWAQVDMSLASENLLQGYISKGRNVSHMDNEECDLVIVA